MNPKLKIIGLAGTNGSGKDTVGQILADKHGYLFVSVSDLLREEARRRDLPVTREVLRTISAEWRREFGLGVLVDKAVDLWKSFGDKYVGVVVCPMRNPGEAQHLKDLGGLLIWVDADPRTRYERIQANAAARGRTGEDDKTFEQFLSEEAAEMNAPAGSDAAVLDMAGVKALTDTFIANDSTDLAKLQADVEQALGLQ
jgi:dephospho-CoA kinase